MILSADWHLGLISDSVRGESGYPSKLEDMKTRAFELIDRAVETNSFNLIVAGDLFEVYDPNGLAWLIFFEIVKYATNQEVTLFIIPGNHDASRDWISLLPLKNLHYTPYLKVISRPKCLNIEGYNTLFIPHLSRKIEDEVKRKYGTYNAYLKTKFKKVDLIITHAHRTGAATNSEIEFGAGDAMLFTPSELPLFKLAILGHIHKHQVLSYKNKPIIYPGSLIPNDFGEVGDSKGYIDLKSNFKWHFCRFKTSIHKYKEIKLDLVNKEFNMSDSQIKKIVNNCIVKVSVMTDKSRLVNEFLIKEKLSKYCHIAKFNIKVVKENEETSSTIEKSGIIHTTLSHKKLLTDWLKKQPNLTRSSMRRTLLLGKDILEELQNDL